MDDKKAAIIKILEMAIIEEIKAKNFYFKMSAQLSNNGAQSRFRHMAEAEQEHEDILKAWYEETCGYPFDVFERLASLEQMHADQSQIEVQMAANESLHFSGDDIPWKI